MYNFAYLNHGDQILFTYALRLYVKSPSPLQNILSVPIVDFSYLR